ncbi:DUF2938 family protein [Sphingomonas histidinilytica]|uniref:DUF2938 domain-containing protein n=1 Tax=Rhizorhabdus histidinilytica TaxID=439228 RepID=A0A1T5BLA8_9SPHN|nr:DUF2938 family protein [Rhizorhabdus histidinilytica]MBO9377398.1 DUF2938 family protein [Rhizorhabdus histidinilytica]SKB47907.1 Protein of unknown function [Rhizorhabdus histidinilytica]
MGDIVARAIVVGVVAVLLFDLWGWALERFFGVRAPNWAILGRWLTPFVERPVPAQPGPPTFGTGERLLGTTAHYITGIVFAGALLLIMGRDWAERPTPLPALTMGLSTVVFAWFVIMPALGHGIAAAKTPFPGRIRIMTLMAHFVFGCGFFLGAIVAAWLVPLA